MRLCSVPGCGKRHNAHGYCMTHERRWKQYGDPLIEGRKPNGSGHLHSSGYVMVRRGGKSDYLHRIIWEEAYGPLPEGWHIHHLNRDKSDNRLANLAARAPSAHAKEHRGKLTDEQVREIRSRHAAGISQHALASEYGVTQPAISRIVRRLSRRDVA